MDAGWALILSAVVTAVGGVIVVLLAQFRKENHDDHNIVMDVLQIMHKDNVRIETKIDKVANTVTDHLVSHSSEGLVNKRGVDKDRAEGYS